MTTWATILSNSRTETKTTACIGTTVNHIVCRTDNNPRNVGCNVIGGAIDKVKATRTTTTTTTGAGDKESTASTSTIKIA